ncbi:MAG: hypothetical protein A4S08_09835 [Proteobacteria bacterium SG_bin4]|nr:MAG: hypothetical protein A4S08_09835 [Proteobacteria bacterium SG_bin4]
MICIKKIHLDLFQNAVSTKTFLLEEIMHMLDEVDVVAFKKLGINLVIIGAVAVALIFVSMYFS